MSATAVFHVDGTRNKFVQPDLDSLRNELVAIREGAVDPSTFAVFRVSDGDDDLSGPNFEEFLLPLYPYD